MISGFSKLSKEAKLDWIAQHFFADSAEARQTMKEFWLEDPELQKILDGFSENTLSNYPFPYGVAPNFLINGQVYAIPMVIEESSVVAAASSAAKFWSKRGGFRAEVLATKKLGQVHFSWKGDTKKLFGVFDELKRALREEAAPLTRNMEARGGGVLEIQLLDHTHMEEDYYQLKVSFETCDSMGANFINSVLEQFARTLESFLGSHPAFEGEEQEVTIIMAILSNYTPECIVRASVACSIEELEGVSDIMDANTFAQKFYKAVRIAHIDPHRATTHNKGIFNGVDAVVLATGNDFRAVEACGHTYAARDGQYRSLSRCEVEDGTFRFWLNLPIALGTVGGLTNLHPLASLSLKMLGDPGAHELMRIIAATGLAQNFAALRSLVTVGIQRGHMKMHLQNILRHLKASDQESEQAVRYFSDRAITFKAVRDFIKAYRGGNGRIESIVTNKR